MSDVETISQQDLYADPATVIDAVTGGNSFVITRDGEPVAELCPVRPGRRTFVPREEIIALAPAGVRIGDQSFRADVDRWIDP